MERIINVELYNEIYTIEEWCEINKKNNENYKLMANLDLKNADPRKYAGQDFYGILDGQGHTIQNMYISKSVGKTLFNLTDSKTKVCNLNIKNYNLEKDGGDVGIFARVLQLENVNVDTVNIKASTGSNIGGIMAYGNGFKIENSTFNNINIQNNYSATTVGIGGLVGEGSGEIKNVYINNLNIKAQSISASH